MKKFITVYLILTIFYFSKLTGQVTFTDVAIPLGVNDPGNAQGVVFLDVNNDGWLDIFLANNNNPSKLWINKNGTSFGDSSTAWGVNITSPTRGIVAADFNNDGNLDVLIGNWQTPIMLFKNTGTTFVNCSTDAGVAFTSYGNAHWIDYNKDGKLDFCFANGGMPPRYNFFFRNDNLTSFTNIAYSIGLVDSTSTLTLSSADYNNDGNMDLFLGTQSNPNAPTTAILYKNNGNGTFTDVTNESGILTNFYTWGSAWGDYNNDGYMDLFLANTTGYNQLYRNNKNGTFTDVTVQMGFELINAAYSCGWADIDNDGDLDLYVARGQNSMDKMYRNDDTIFTDITTQCGMGDYQLSSATSWGDFNNDGFLDLYLNNNGYENRLYRNSGNSNKWIILKLNGVTSNRSAIGTRVKIVTGGKSQIREVEGGSGGKGQNSLPIEFGIGSASYIDTLIIKWIGGTQQIFTHVTPNKIYTVTEGQPLAVNNISSNVPDKFDLSQNYPNPFNPITNIKYQIAKNSQVILKVYNILGNEVETLVNEKLAAGTYQVTFDATKLSSGIYFYKLITNDFSETKKMILVK